MLTSEMMHWLGEGDTVRRAGLLGMVLDSGALRAAVRWEDGADELVEQHDPTVEVVERASRAA